MRKYDFTLKFALGRHDADPGEFVERLLNEGCDDALIGSGKHGRIALNFAREAQSADEAFLTAISDIKRAIPDATFVEASPDLVGIPDIANVLGVSRQYVRKLVEENCQDFPMPVHDGKRHYGTLKQCWRGSPADIVTLMRHCWKFRALRCIAIT